MRTRRMRLSQDHVGALNLVEIEFREDRPVIDAWKAYWSHLAKPYPLNESKTIQDQYSHERNSLYTKLLDAIAKALHFDIEQLEIFEGGYVPQGWEDDWASQLQIRALLLDTLSVKLLIPITQLSAHTENNLYTPYPNTTPR